jgi:hypothetical protein
MRTLLSDLSKGFNFAGVPDLPLLGSQSHVNIQMHQSALLMTTLMSQTCEQA